MASLEPQARKPLNEKLKLMDKIADDINSKAGKKIMGRLGREEDQEGGILEKMRIKFIPTPSRNFNDATSGGFPRGRTSLVVGNPDSGKTSLLLETIGKNMKEDPDFTAAWLESEDSLEENYVVNTMGVDPDRFTLIEQQRKDAGEAALDRLEACIASGAYDMVVVNSLKAIVPSEEYKKSISDGVVGVQARMNARMTRKYTAPISESDTALVLVTHLSTDIGTMFGDPTVITGGKAIIYAASLIADLRKRSITDDDPIDKDEGIKVGVTIKKNHCVPDKNPYVKTDYYAIFGQGIEQYMTTMEAAIDKGILIKAGPYIREVDSEGEIVKSDDGKEMKFRGKKAFIDYCKEKPEYFQSLQDRIDGKVEEMSQEEIEEVEQEQEEITKEPE